MKFGATHNPDGTPKLKEGITGTTPPNVPSSDTSVNDAEMKKLQRQNNVTPVPPAVIEPLLMSVIVKVLDVRTVTL